MSIECWTGQETRLLRGALRMSVRAFADHLGVAARTVSKWELYGSARMPKPELQSALDTVLRRADDEVRRRFELMLNSAGSRQIEPIAVPPEVARDLVTSNIGLPTAHLGAVQLGDLVELLQDQWHLLVKSDNIFGPRYALRGVLDQLHLIKDVLAGSSGANRLEMVRIAARYAESASWLCEDAGEPLSARAWNVRAQEWAQEAGDRLMVAWSMFRESQQAAAVGRAEEAVTLALTAGLEPHLLPITRAAIAQQAAHGFAMQGDEAAANQHLEQAHRWAAANDDGGDARTGHGAFCTETYLELQRASCLLTLHRPEQAITLYDAVLPQLAPIYRRDRGHALSRLALARTLAGQPEQAASAAQEALSIARATGSHRTEREAAGVALRLREHHALPDVALFLHEMAASFA